MTLTGTRIRLRPMREDDSEDCLRWLQDPDVSPASSRWEVTLEGRRQWIEDRLDAPEGYFEIETLDGVHIGNASIHGVSDRDRSGMLSIHIGEKAYWGQGLGTDVMQVLLRYGFEERGLHRIELGVYAFNERAVALYRSLGFRHEGTRRDVLFFRGTFHDEHVMAMLEDDWRGELSNDH